MEEKQIEAQKCDKLIKEMEEKDEKLNTLEILIRTYQQKFGEMENQPNKLQIREMKVQLPLENWHDLLAFVPRPQLGEIVPQIGDRKFASIIQPFLHEIGEITIGKMRIIKPRVDVPSDRPMMSISYKRKYDPLRITNMPDWPMPRNIKTFVEIDLKMYADKFVLDFLQKFQQQNLLANVNLCFEDNLTEHSLLPFLHKVLPLISSIKSICSYNIDLLKIVYNNDNNSDDGNGNSNESDQLILKRMMLQTRILSVDWHPSKCLWEEKIDWCCQWLNSPRDDGKPRMLISYSSFGKTTTRSSLVVRILKDFENANNPISFFVLIFMNSEHEDNTVQSIFRNNGKTNEQLVIKATKLHDGRQMMISRYPSDAAKDWIETNEKEICNGWTDRTFILEEEYIY